jgi:Tfp pilus assembly protein PilF
MDPASHAIHENFGTALSAQGKIKEAIAECRAAIELDQTCPYPHQQLAGVLSGQGKLAEATDECRTAIRLEPASAYSHQQFAGILYDHGKLAEASDEYRTAIRLDPAGAYAHAQLAAILSAQGKLAEAKDEYRTVLRLEPDKAWAHNQFAWALVRSPDRPRHDYDEALELSRKAVKLAPKEGNYVNTLALAEYRVGHWGESIAASERSMALGNGGSAFDWFFLALAHWKKGEKDKAAAWFDKAVAWTKEKDPRNTELRQFWKEAADLLRKPGPGLADASSAPSPATAQPP